MTGMEEDPIVGIDLGTTNSEVAYMAGGRPQVVEEDGDRGIVPSAVGIDRAGRVIVGREARNQQVAAPERTVLSIKRKMGSGEKVSLGEESYSPQEVSAFILRALRERAERALGRPVKRAVITVPAYFSDAQRQATREAGAIAGLEVVRILNEPTAAALVYEAGAASRAKVLVYDLGGGTFDVSIVSVEQGVVEVLASNGDTHLGGDDFDDRIVERLVSHLREEQGLEAGEDRLLRARLRRSAEAAKIELSMRPWSRIAEDHVGEVDGKPVHLDYELTRRDFEAMIAESLDRTMACVSRALADARLHPADIEKVLLVGGSTRIPRVAELLRERLGREPHGEIDPDLSVALGAGVQAGIEMGVDVKAVLVDITPYTFGTSCLAERDGRPDPYRYVPLIRRNSKLPAEWSEVFYTVHQDQQAVTIDVYQGEDPDARRNLHIASFHFGGLNRSPGLWEQGILFTYRLNLDGILEVHAVERGSGREVRGQVENALGRSSEAELKAAGERVAARWGGQEAGAEPAPAPPEVEAEVEVEVPRLSDTLRRAERVMQDAEEEDRKEMAELVRAIRAALAGGRIEEAEERQRELEEIVFFLE